MVNTLILIGLILLVTNALTGFLVFKGVHLGLRWQVEVRQERPPTMETPVKNPIEAIQEVFSQPKEEKVNSLIDEWVNGAKE